MARLWCKELPRGWGGGGGENYRRNIIVNYIEVGGIVFQSIKCQTTFILLAFQKTVFSNMKSLYPILPCKFPKTVHPLFHTYITNVPVTEFGIFFSHIPILKEHKDVITRRGDILKGLCPSPSCLHGPGEERGSGNVSCCSSYLKAPRRLEVYLDLDCLLVGCPS